MNNIVLNGLNLLLNFFEVIALYLLGDCFFQRKYRGKPLILCIGVLLLGNVICHLIADRRLVEQIILLMIVDTVWLVFIFRVHILKCLITFMFYISLILLGDSIFIMALSSAMGVRAQAYLQNPYGNYLLCFIAKIVEFLIIVLLKLAIAKKTDSQATNWRDWVRTIMFPAMSVIIAVVLMQVYATNETAALQILICSIVLVMTDMLAILLLSYLEQQQKELQDFAILKHASKLAQDSVAAWMSAYDSQRRQTHDFQNQLCTIQGLAQQESQNEKLLEYIQGLLHTDISGTLIVKTGRPVADAVLNQKYALAQSKEIAFRVQLDNLTEFVLSDEDLVVVLSNLIDNAIEACEKIVDPAMRKIQLEMKTQPDTNRLYIENTTAEPVKIRDGRVVTTKKNTREHGYGLKNIETIFERYEAMYAIDYDEKHHMFRFSVQIVPSIN